LAQATVVQEATRGQNRYAPGSERYGRCQFDLPQLRLGQPVLYVAFEAMIRTKLNKAASGPYARATAIQVSNVWPTNDEDEEDTLAAIELAATESHEASVVNGEAGRAKLMALSALVHPNAPKKPTLEDLARAGRPKMPLLIPSGVPGATLVDNTCWDFLRGTCFRGAECKYSHPPSANANVGRKNPLAGISGEPSHAGRGTDTSGAVRCSPMQAGAPMIPCKDFLYNQCVRGYDCKFSHIPQERDQQEQTDEGQNSVRPAGAKSPAGSAESPEIRTLLEVQLAKIEELQEAQVRIENQLDDMKAVLTRVVEAIGG